jgi:hypothetical protein
MIRRAAVEQLLLAHLSLAAALTIGNGSGPWPVPLVLVALGLVALALRDGRAGAPSPRFAALVVVANLALALVRSPGNDLVAGAARWPFVAAAVAMAGAALIGLRRPRLAVPLLAALVSLHLGAGALLLRDSPAPRIDVFVIQQEGARAFLDGKNPYRAVFANPYSPAETRAFFGDDRRALVDYPYPPASLYAGALAYAAAGDVRWALLALQAATGLLLFLLARRRGPPERALLVAYLLALHPRGLLVVEQAWTEPLAAAALALALLALDGAAWVAGLAVGALLAAKQYAVLVTPLLARRRLLDRAAWPWALGAAALTTVPLFAWDPRAFVDDVVLFQLRQPLRLDALSLPPIVALLTGLRLPGALALVGAAAAAAWAWRKLPAGARGLSTGGALLLLAFFVSAKQAFCNYYWLASVLVLAAAATAPIVDDVND